MIHKNTKLCCGLLIIVALIYLLNNCQKSNNIESCQNDIEHYESALDNILKNDQNNSQNDAITKWNDEFNHKNATQDSVKPQEQEQVQGQSDDNSSLADFTSDGKNYYNNLTHFDSADLLPKPDKEQPGDNGWTYKHGANWDESNPQIAQVDGNAWLNERKFLGMYTVGSTLRNATHDIRRDIPNPQAVVSPWNNTTILPDANSKGLCTL